MPALLGLLIVVIVAYALYPKYITVSKAAFILGCGLLLVLFAPAFANAVDSSIRGSETWLSTFRLLGFCLFLWGLVEKVIEIIRPTGNQIQQ